MSAPDYSPWRIAQRLGTGTLTEAFTAEGPQPSAVLKRLLPFYADNELLSAAFILCGEEMKTLEHPAILRVFATGTAGRDRFLVVERAEGRALSRVFSRLEQKGWQALPQIPVVACAYQAAKALAYAHSRGVLHVDVSLHNLYLAPSGHVRICDFGLAHARRSYAPDAGSVELIPPELRAGAKPDARVDIWQLAASTYMLLAGGLPPSALSRGFPTLSERVESADEILTSLLMKALSPIPSERPLAMAEVVAGLGNWLDRAGVTDAAAAAQGLYRNVFADEPAEDSWSVPSVLPWPDAPGTAHKVFGANESTPTSPKGRLSLSDDSRRRRFLLAGAGLACGLVAFWAYVFTQYSKHDDRLPEPPTVVPEQVVASKPVVDETRESASQSAEDQRKLPLFTSALPAEFVVSSERHGFFVDEGEGRIIPVVHEKSDLLFTGQTTLPVPVSLEASRVSTTYTQLYGGFLVLIPKQGMRRLIYAADRLEVPAGLMELRAGFFSDRATHQVAASAPVELYHQTPQGRMYDEAIKLDETRPFHLGDDERFTVSALDPSRSYVVDVAGEAWHDGLLAIVQGSHRGEAATVENAPGGAGHFMLRPGSYVIRRATSVFFTLPRTYGANPAQFTVKVAPSYVDPNAGWVRVPDDDDGAVGKPVRRQRHFSTGEGR